MVSRGKFMGVWFGVSIAAGERHANLIFARVHESGGGFVPVGVLARGLLGDFVRGAELDIALVEVVGDAGVSGRFRGGFGRKGGPYSVMTVLRVWLPPALSRKIWG